MIVGGWANDRFGSRRTLVTRLGELGIARPRRGFPLLLSIGMLDSATRMPFLTFLPFLLMTPFFFAGGASFAYFLAMPWALHFLLSYQGNVGGVTQEALPGVGNYLSFVMRFLFGFGIRRDGIGGDRLARQRAELVPRPAM